MKSYIYFFIAILAVMITSCTTTEKFNINTDKGTKVTLPSSLMGELSTTKTGETKVEIPADCYLGYINLLSKDMDIPVPMGINYKIKKRTGAKFASGTGMALMSVGSVITLSGAIALLMDDEHTNTVGVGAGMAGAGAAVVGLGAGIGFPSMQRLKQTSYDYNFSYDTNQELILPKMSKTLINPNSNKPKITTASSTKKSKQAQSGQTSDTKNFSGYTASKKKNDYAKHVAGQYNGNGKLLLKGNTDETYENVRMTMKRLDSGHVSVEILVDSEPFFDTPLIYSVQSNDANGYLLRIENLPEATISIDNNSNIYFHHPKVLIDGDIYVLDISAKR